MKIVRIEQVVILILLVLCIVLGYLFYRGNNEKAQIVYENNTKIDSLTVVNTYLKKQLTINKVKQDSINILLLNNLKFKDNEIHNIINMPDSIKLRLLSKRYNY